MSDKLISKNPIVKKATKDNLYKDEQKSILERVLKIIDLVPNDETHMISKNDLVKKFDQIKQLFDEIYVYYSSSITTSIKRSTNSELAAIKMVLRHHGYDLKYKTKGIKKGDDWTTTSYYYIITN